MIHQGTDGVSRGSLQEGVYLSKSMLAYFPWDKSGCQRSPTLLDWFKDWLGDSVELLYPQDWYHQGQYLDVYYQDNSWLWCPKVKSGVFFGISL